MSNKESHGEHNNPESDSVPAEGLEIVGFDVLHQEFDGQHRDNEGNDHPDSEDRALVAGEMVEVAQLQQRAAEHRRDRQEEREFRG